MIRYTFFQLLPIFLLIGGGYLLTRIYTLSLDTLVKVITDFLMPLLIFHALYTSDIEPELILDLAGATTLVVVLMLIAAYIYARLVSMDPRVFIPAIIFMNSGFLGIPLMKLWGGQEAMNLIVIYDQIQTIYVFVLGILILTGGISLRGLREIVRSPILWAIGAGFLFRFTGIVLPEPLLTAFDFGGTAAPPLAALTLGVSLAETKLSLNIHLVSGLLLRTVGGFLCGLLAAALFGLTGLSRTVVLVTSMLPSAVFTSVLPLRYGVEADFAGTMVVVSTLLGILTIPLAFALAV
jgi:malate permease and related proteins